MFSLSHVSDVVRIIPEHFDAGAGHAGPQCMPHREALVHALTNKYVGKVVPQCGLVVTLYDLVNIDASFLIPGDGASWTRVQFLIAVFRPVKGVVLTGVISRMDSSGIYISLGFHEDVCVSPAFLQPDSHFNADRMSYVWNGRHPETGEPFEVYYEKNKVVRCVVMDVLFREKEEGPGAASVTWVMVLRCGMNSDGLGMEEWWA